MKNSFNYPKKGVAMNAGSVIAWSMMTVVALPVIYFVFLVPLALIIGGFRQMILQIKNRSK